MKKISLATFAIFTIACNNPSTSETTDRKPVSKNIYGYKGNIKTCTCITTQYDIYSTNTIVTTTRYRYDSFNTDGNIILSREYNDIPDIPKNDTITSINKTDGDRITQTLVYFNNKEVLKKIYTWTNDTQFTETTYENDSIKHKTSYTLSNYFHLVKMKYNNYQSSYKEEATTEIQYNENNEIVGSTFSLRGQNEATMTDIKIVTKDKQGNPLETMWYDNKSGKLITRKTTSYTYY